MKKNRIDVQHLHSVPSYSLLYHDNYRWVGDYLKLLATKKQIKELESEKKSVELVSPTQGDFMRRLKKNYDELAERGATNLLGFLIGQYQNPNPVSFLRLRLASGDYNAPFLLPSWENFQAAADKINLEGPTIEESERVKIITKIDKSLEKCRSKLKALHPDEFCIFYDNGHLEEDFRNTFVKFWKTLQTNATGPISPIGVDLSASVEPEREAWKLLGLGRFVSPIAPFLPYPGDGLRPKQLIPAIPAKKPLRVF